MGTVLVPIKRQLFLRDVISNFGNKLVVALTFFHPPVLPTSHHLCNRATVSIISFAIVVESFSSLTHLHCLHNPDDIAQ